MSEQPDRKPVDRVKEEEKKQDKVNVQHTAASAVIRALKKAKAFDAASAVSYDVLKEVHLSTPVLAYTIANLVEEGVVIRPQPDRYYFSQAGWKRIEKRVYSGYAILILVPLVAVIVFLLLQKFWH